MLQQIKYPLNLLFGIFIKLKTIDFLIKSGTFPILAYNYKISHSNLYL
jgi:hypothetical protein